MPNEQNFDEVKYENEQKIIDGLFPDCPFTISIDLDELYNVVSPKNRIMLIHNNMTCICCGDVPLYKTKNQKSCGVWVNASNTEIGVTNYDCLMALYLIRWEPNCNHSFVESFDKIRYDLYEVSCGS